MLALLRGEAAHCKCCHRPQLIDEMVAGYCQRCDSQNVFTELDYVPIEMEPNC